MRTHFKRCFSWMADCLQREYNDKVFPNPTCSYEIQSYAFQQIDVKYDFFQVDGKKIPYVQLSTTKSRKSKKCAIYFHGNGEDIGHIQYIVYQLVLKANLTIYGLEYPCYGLYQKFFRCRISDNIKSDSILFYQFLISKDRTYKDIVVIGRSIGSGPASYLAGHKLIQALILISPFDKIKNWTKKFGLWGKLIKQHFNNIQEIEKFNGRFMVIHGQKDHLIDIEHSKRLVNAYESHNSLKEDAVKVYPPLMTHNNFDTQEDIADPIKKFLQEIKFLQIKSI